MLEPRRCWRREALASDLESLGIIVAAMNVCGTPLEPGRWWM